MSSSDEEGRSRTDFGVWGMLITDVWGKRVESLNDINFGEMFLVRSKCGDMRVECLFDREIIFGHGGTEMRSSVECNIGA